MREAPRSSSSPAFFGDFGRRGRKLTWTTIPREYTTAKENENVQFQIKRGASNQRSIYVANVLEDHHNNRQISDVAWRLPS